MLQFNDKIQKEKYIVTRDNLMVNEANELVQQSYRLFKFNPGTDLDYENQQDLVKVTLFGVMLEVLVKSLYSNNKLGDPLRTGKNSRIRNDLYEDVILGFVEESQVLLSAPQK